MTASYAELASEARYLHRCFFRADAPSEVVDRYIGANVECGIAPSALVQTIVTRGLDAEAVELILRSRKSPGVLTKKIRILFYLAEVRSENYSAFFGTAGKDESRMNAWFGLFGGMVQSAAKYLKGAYLVRRHGLV